MLNRKVMTLHLIVGLVKKKKTFSQYFPKPYKSFRGGISVKVDISDYARKADFEYGTGIDTSKLALKSNLANLKAEIDTIDADKLKIVPIDLSKLSNVVDNDIVKKIVYDRLVPKVNNIDTGGFILYTDK